MKLLISLIVALTLLPQFLLAKAPLLSHGVTYHAGIAVQDYLVSEKLDGVRAYWDGKNLISRKGNILHAPQWFTAPLPATPLDGELWSGRGEFEKIMSTVRKHTPVDSEWHKIKYMLFELPNSSGDFNQRYRQMEQLITTMDASHVRLIQQQQVGSVTELNKLLDKVVDSGGEGLMLHLMSSLYTTGRTSDIVKLKKRYDDEAIVIQHIAGKGKFTGMLGSLAVENRQGIRFRVGTGFSHLERQTPPAIGSTITYSYFGFTAKGIPRFPSFLRVRQDI